MKAIENLIRAAQATCQSVNGSNPAATRRQHTVDLANLAAAILPACACADQTLGALELIEHTAISGMDGDMLAALQDNMQTARAAIAKAKG